MELLRPFVLISTGPCPTIIKVNIVLLSYCSESDLVPAGTTMTRSHDTNETDRNAPICVHLPYHNCMSLVDLL